MINLLLSLLVFNQVRNYRQIHLNEPNAHIFYSKWDEIKGCDERFPKNETIKYNEIYNINRYILIKKIVQDLEDSDNSIITKMNILDKYSFLFEYDIKVNIKNGGLLDDFNFNLVEEDHQA